MPSTYQILYWQEIPTQVKAWDDFDDAKLEMPPGFMERVDNEAQKQGLTKMENYTAQFKWSEEKEHEGEPDETVKAIVAQLTQNSSNA